MSKIKSLAVDDILFYERIKVNKEKVFINCIKNNGGRLMERRFGKPRTEEERLERHESLFGEIELPPRGTRHSKIMLEEMIKIRQLMGEHAKKSAEECDLKTIFYDLMAISSNNNQIMAISGELMSKGILNADEHQKNIDGIIEFNNRLIDDLKRLLEKNCSCKQKV